MNGNEYWISYTFMKENRRGFGNAIAEEFDALTEESITAIKNKIIEDNDFSSCTILNIVKLDA